MWFKLKYFFSKHNYIFFKKIKISAKYSEYANLYICNKCGNLISARVNKIGIIDASGFWNRRFCPKKDLTGHENYIFELSSRKESIICEIVDGILESLENDSKI